MVPIKTFSLNVWVSHSNYQTPHDKDFSLSAISELLVTQAQPTRPTSVTSSVHLQGAGFSSTSCRLHLLRSRVEIIETIMKMRGPVVYVFLLMVGSLLPAVHGCICMPSHPQQDFCRADLGKMLSKTFLTHCLGFKMNTGGPKA